MNNHDYFMREIERISEFLGNALFTDKKEAISLTDKDGNVSAEGFLFHRLIKLVNEGKINEAENMLYSEKEKRYADLDYIKIGIAFYTELEALSDERLCECNFTREEIANGLNDLCNI